MFPSTKAAVPDKTNAMSSLALQNFSTFLKLDPVVAARKEGLERKRW